ncbi:MAG: hypothetical protein ABR860_12950 [Terracidiphilus sp.]
MSIAVEKPTVDAVRATRKKFDEENKIIEDALEGLFEHYPKNVRTSDVLLKVLTLNALYSTQIPLYGDRIPTVWQVVDHIVQLGIDPALDLGSPNLVFNIAKIEIRDKVHFNYSFATKYCNWHRPEFYPIYDSRVDEYLWHLANQELIGHFDRQELKIYPRLKEIVCEFRDRYGLGDFNFKQIDKFLYYEGGKLLSAKQKGNELEVSTEPQI